MERQRRGAASTVHNCKLHEERGIMLVSLLTIVTTFLLMQNQRGFIGVGVLIAILVGLAVLGGGAYYVVQQQASTQTTSDNFDNAQQLPTTNNQQAQTTAKAPPPTTPIQNPTPISQSGTFTVPSTFTINKGQTIAQAGLNNGVTIKYKEYKNNPYERVLPGQEYCANSTLSYVGSVATEFDAKGITIIVDGENGFTSCNPNTASDPVLYNGLKISVTNFTSSSATYKAEFAPDSAQATINQSSLSSNTSSPIISGTAPNLKHVTVYIYKDPKSIDPATIKIGDGVKSVAPIATTPGIVGYVDVVNGAWSTGFVQFNDASGSPVSLPDGIYKVNVAHPYSRYSLTTGTLIIKTR